MKTFESETPIYAELYKEKKWDVPLSKLPEQTDKHYTPANGYPEHWPAGESPYTRKVKDNPQA